MEAECKNCGRGSRLISSGLGLCVDCIRTDFANVEGIIRDVHWESRRGFGLPPAPPQDPNGVKCRICTNECQIPEGNKGFCGLRENRDGKLIHIGGTVRCGILEWYYDSLPTNCVADWVCPGGSGSGYPKFSYARGPEYGYKNLAVFYESCSFDCLFCQNWHYREGIERGSRMSASQLAGCVDSRTACICYFGGDPTPQLPHAIKVSREALERNGERILRICWETNGSMSRAMLEKIAELSLSSGGCIKFDLKAWSRELNIALTGVSNERTLENFSFLAQMRNQRPDPPFLVASTLLVPGYIDVKEVSKLARFIASLGSDIPYALLAFHPHFYMPDLPTTSRGHAMECLEAARGQGLKNVRVGNLHLLSAGYQ